MGFDYVALDEYFDLVSPGVQPFKGTKKYIATGSLETGRITGFEEFDFDSRPTRANMEAIEGDILFAKMKDTEKVFVVSKEDSDNLYSTGFVIMRVKDKTEFSSKFIYYWVKSKEFQALKNRECTGATQKAIGESKVRRFKVPKPTLSTQKKIASILEKAEALKTSREGADRLTDELLKSVFYEMFGDPVKNEKGWERKRLSEFGTWRSGGTPSRRKPDYFNGVIPWYSSGELNSIYISESLERISETAIKDSAAKLIKPDSLLLGMYDTAALKSSITTKICACNQAIAFSELEKKNIDITYLYYAIQIGRKFFMSQQRGVRQKNLNLDMIKNLQVPVPSVIQQKKFSKIVVRIESLKKNQILSNDWLDGYFYVLAQQAFSGELI